MAHMLLFVLVSAAAAGASGTVPGEDNAAEVWAQKAFESARPPDQIALKVVRQDHNVLSYGRSCMETPIRIGSRTFPHGLGTHAASIIVVEIPAGAASFRAFAGIDNNDDTQGERGSAIFAVSVDGNELLRTDVLRGGDEPVPIILDVPPGAKTLTLQVDPTEDGVGWDQADWAEAQFLFADGSKKFVDDNHAEILPEAGALPFSFIYGGRPSSEFLNSWPREISPRDGAAVKSITWTEPATKLAVTAEVKVFASPPAVDWVLYFENRGTVDTPIIEDIQALDVQMRTGYPRRNPVLHELEGDACAESSFLPKSTAIKAGDHIERAPTGGRSSSISAFPWFSLEYEGEGVIAAIGWTGQWKSRFDRSETGPTRVRAGMEKTRLVLMPGERIRTPRIVMMPYRGNRMDAQNQWRRLVLNEYVPKLDGQPVKLPTALQTFDRYNSRPGWATIDGQLKAVEMAAEIGCDSYWFDAAWFPGNFPNGVGNWFHKAEAFPQGLKPIGDACDAHGLRFIVWFEPERVAPGTQIAKEHPEFVFGGENGGLFKLNEPAARQWLTDLLSARIEEYGIDIYRNDFNMDPLPSWRANDAENRQGITEIRYIENLYAMWDELLARHPGLLIDNCSSGGRRIDIEMCSRSVPLWRSDTNCFAGNPEWSQAQTAALSLYVPLNNACTWSTNLYECRSATTGGLLCQFPYLDEAFSPDKAKAAIEEARQSQQYFYGDIYPLTATNVEQDQFAAFQFHRPDLNAGVVMAFRRAQCPLAGIICGLKGIDPGTSYALETISGDGERVESIVAGTELAGNLQLRVEKQNGSLVVRYRKK